MIGSGPAVSQPAPLNAVSDLTAVGSEKFVERTKVELGIRAKGRKILEGGEGYQHESRRPLIVTFLIPKMPVLGLKTATSGTSILIFQYDSMARPH